MITCRVGSEILGILTERFGSWKVFLWKNLLYKILYNVHVSGLDCSSHRGSTTTWNPGRGRYKRVHEHREFMISDCTEDMIYRLMQPFSPESWRSPTLGSPHDSDSAQAPASGRNADASESFVRDNNAIISIC